MGEIFRRIRYLLNRRRFDAELESDMEFHREMAARAGRSNFGNTLRMREQAREAWGWTWLDRLVQDLSYASAYAGPLAGLHRDRGTGAGDRHWCECGGLQPVQHGGAGAIAGARSGVAGAAGAAVAGTTIRARCRICRRYFMGSMPSR